MHQFNIGSDNGLSLIRSKAIMYTNAMSLSITPLGTNFGDILIKIQTFSFRKMHLEMSSAKWRPYSLISGSIYCYINIKVLKYDNYFTYAWLHLFLSISEYFSYYTFVCISEYIHISSDNNNHPMGYYVHQETRKTSLRRFRRRFWLNKKPSNHVRFNFHPWFINTFFQGGRFLPV